MTCAYPGISKILPKDTSLYMYGIDLTQELVKSWTNLYKFFFGAYVPGISKILVDSVRMSQEIVKSWGS